MAYKHAVLAQIGSQDYWYILSDTASQSMYAPSLTQLHSYMEEHKLDVLWAMPGSQFEKVIRAEHFLALQPEYNVYVPQDTLNGGSGSSKKMYGARVRAVKQGSHDRFFMFPGNREWKCPQNHDHGIWFAPEPENLLRTVQYLQQEYQVPIMWSPSNSGMTVLRKMHKEDHVEIAALPEAQMTLFCDEIARNCCQSTGWASAANLHGTYLIGYDKNGQFLGAAQSVELGNGVFHRSRKFNPDVTGFWYFHVENHRGPFNGKQLPRILDREEGWAHTDLVTCALQNGTMLKVQGGYVWQESNKYLERWAKGMWRHRANFKTSPEYADVIARSNAASTGKMIPNTLVGRLAHASSGNYHRPDWNWGIQNRAQANQAYSLAHIYREFGIAPCLVSKDAFYIATYETDPAKAIPNILKHEHEQRGFKCIGITPITPEIEQAFGRINDKKFGVPGIEGTIVRGIRSNCHGN